MNDAEFTFDHVHLRVKDLEATLAWYVTMFGAKVLRRGESSGAPLATVEIGGSRLQISQALPRENLDEATPRKVVNLRYGLSHWGYEVQDLDATVARMKSHGAEFVREIYTIRPGVRAAFVKAPDEDTIELLERKG